MISSYHNKNNVFKTRLTGKEVNFIRETYMLVVVKQISKPDVLVLQGVERKTEQ
jgi:hypothetical protein